MTTKSTRRTFLATAPAAGLTILPSLRAAVAYDANERLNLALFGTKYNAQHFLRTCHVHNAPIVALCDPERKKREKVLETWKKMGQKMSSSPKADDQQWGARYAGMGSGESVKIHTDIRRLSDEMADSFDALVVSNVDHLHGIACGLALRAGKPVFSERPIGHNISDARKLRALAGEANVPVSYRSPGTGANAFRRAMELVAEGAIGKVTEAHIWNARRGADRSALPTEAQPIPEGLDWDHWLGPLPARPYHRDWMAYATWRETCNGDLAGIGAHAFIFPFLCLNFRALWDRPAGGAPVIRVTAECSRQNPDSFPLWEKTRWEIPARGDLPPVNVTWHKGPDYSPGSRELLRAKLAKFGVATGAEADALLGGLGSLIVGSDGALVGNGHSTEITCLPAAKFEPVEIARPLRIPASRKIQTDWVSACRGGDAHILANFENGGRLSEMLMAGSLATRYPGETLSYDPARGRFTNKAEANAHLGIEYRDGWEI